MYFNHTKLKVQKIKLFFNMIFLLIITNNKYKNIYFKTSSKILKNI